MIKELEDPSPDGCATTHANPSISIKLNFHSISTYSSGAAGEIQMLASSIADAANTNAYLDIWNIPSADTSSCLDTIMGAKMGALDVDDFDLLLNWFLAQFARNTFASYYQWGDAATGDFMGWVFSGKQE
ncbi:hypothetical protein HK101_007152, partial [Irineochytrium annulatum]